MPDTGLIFYGNWFYDILPPYNKENVLTLVFTDASSAILLYKTDLFIPAVQAFSMVLSQAVFREITVPGYPGAGMFKEVRKQKGFNIENPTEEAMDPVLSADKDFARMDTGEKETLALFYLYQKKGDSSFVLMDDGQGARYCGKHKIPYINALLVPKLFWYSGLMDQKTAHKKTNQLVDLGRYSKKIIQIAQHLTEKDLAPFIPEKTHGN